MKKLEEKEQAVQDALARVAVEGQSALLAIEDYNVLKATLERLTDENLTLMSSIEQLREVNGEYIKVGEQKDLELAEALKLIEEQQKALSVAEGSSESVIITVDKKKFRVVVPVFNVKGVHYKAEDLKENKELAKELVDKKSSILKAL